MNKQSFERSHVRQIRIHVMPTDRFKTFSISLFAGTPLREQTVTPTALLPFVLRRGTKRYPLTKQFRERLDDLYGAGFGFDIYKRGDYQMVQFKMDTIHQDYVHAEKDDLLRASLTFLGEVLCSPVIENDILKTQYVQSEKNTLTKRIESIINDKIRYAAERCVEEMCKDEPYRLHPLGQIERIPEIDAESLTSHYHSWLNEAVMDLYVVGNTTMEEVTKIVEEAFPLSRSSSPGYESHSHNVQAKDVQTVVERLDVTQGKLNLGLRSKIRYADQDYPAALMYNGVLGAYPHSKLFINVREKESLAYYAASRYDGHKGIITIQSGIEIENYEKALRIIQKQLDSMKNGEITDLELAQTKAMIRNQLLELNDSAFEMIGYDFNGVLSGVHRDTDAFIEMIEQIDRGKVQQAAEQVELDTVYFLRNEKEVLADADKNV
ncbi:EF-P 5-aminopentanol modification-associated protein YfmF [Marinicrinis lubricantis]|uniref:EF-P 5-aminopentanol modification-associated protein YfmF n=1 Tax=Marinicrinis lubricantis TaxID=2086470 RepID=A0ABW1IMB7_9BACL